jgi:hypothetical protein
MCLKFGFVIFWQKDFGAKAAHKMLVKLTPVHNLWKNNFYNWLQFGSKGIVWFHPKVKGFGSIMSKLINKML